MLALSLDDFDVVRPLHPISKIDRISIPEFFAIPELPDGVEEELFPIRNGELVPLVPMPLFSQTDRRSRE